MGFSLTYDVSKVVFANQLSGVLTLRFFLKLTKRKGYALTFRIARLYVLFCLAVCFSSII